MKKEEYSPPLFSLILATIHRTTELYDFLDSLSIQKCQSFELIIVDQNTDDRLDKIIQNYQNKIPILHLKSPKGLSRARNVGLRFAKGTIVAFPDDDCWYPTELLANVQKTFSDEPDLVGVTGICVNKEGKNSVAVFDNTEGPLTRENVWRRAVSISIFAKLTDAQAIGGFDETLGVGADTRWQSGEETDFLLRLIGKGSPIKFLPTIRVGHPSVDDAPASMLIERAKRYSPGAGYVAAKNGYPTSHAVKTIIRSLIGSLISLFTFNKTKFFVRLYRAIGFLSGWISHHKKNK